MSAFHCLADYHEWLHAPLGEPKDWLNGLFWGAVFAGPAAIAFEVVRRRWGLLSNKKIHRSPTDVPAESLVKGKRVRKVSGPELIRAINLGAHEVLARVRHPDHLSDCSQLEAAWGRTSFAEHARLITSFISPRCTVAPVGGRGAMEDDALRVLLEWLRRPPKVLHGEIRGDTGVGKTMLLYQLFVCLVRSNANVIPMLASADNINQNSAELERLKHERDHISAFASVWLKNRQVIAKTEADQKAMERAIKTAVESGDVVLLLDGIDQLREKGAEDFVDGLLAGAKRWIVTRRYEESAKQEPTGHVITLEPAWSRRRILEYVGRRLAGKPEAASLVESVLEKLIPEKGTASHWLSNPDSLRAYVDEVARTDRPATEAEMYRLAESATGLMENLFMRDMRGIDGAKPEEIREELSVLAFCPPGDSRAWSDGPVGAKVAGLKTLLRRDGKSLVFRHPAEAEYFLARRLARELNDGPSNWADATGLQAVVENPWGIGRISLVAECLRMGAGSDRTENVASWLTALGNAPSKLAAQGKRNLLDVWKRTRFENEANSGRQPISCLNLDGIDGRGLDLKDERIESCSFNRADLRDAEMMHAQILNCQFAKADLRCANVIGAEFEGCSFGEGEEFAQVDGLEIEGIQINPPELYSKLASKGARSQRSRYRGKFGEHFLKAQRAFLGPAVDKLETDVYVPAIWDAVDRAMEKRADARIYLIDLMAGGHGARSDELLAKFRRLHILSIDRDSTERNLGERHQWMNLEFSGESLANPAGTDPFELAARFSMAVGEGVGKADVVIAKKALHELERPLQLALIQSCNAVLRPGGRLVLFVDAPGAENGPIDSAARVAAIQRHELLRNLLLNPATHPDEVKRFFSASHYPADSNGEWLFVNDWIAVKDWANLNRHELEHRYFASIAEIREWARPWFGEAVQIQTNSYDINPLRFNERGINSVLHYLERFKDNREAVVEQNRAMLVGELDGSEKFRALVDITRKVFGKSSAFAKMMNAEPSRVQLAAIEPLLAPLETSQVAPQFKIKCGVIEFERRPV
jgi:SAM-dependent methyltransferase